MASLLANAMRGQAAAGVPLPGNIQNMLTSLNQFRGTFGAMMNAQNPAQAAQAILEQRGLPAGQFQNLVNQYAAQATEIQKQLMGMGV